MSSVLTVCKPQCGDLAKFEIWGVWFRYPLTNNFLRIPIYTARHWIRVSDCLTLWWQENITFLVMLQWLLFIRHFMSFFFTFSRILFKPDFVGGLNRTCQCYFLCPTKHNIFQWSHFNVRFWHNFNSSSSSQNLVSRSQQTHTRDWKEGHSALKSAITPGEFEAFS